MFLQLETVLAVKPMRQKLEELKIKLDGPLKVIQGPYFWLMQIFSI